MMLKKLKQVFRKRSAGAKPKSPPARIIPAAAHSLSPQVIPKAAAEVVTRLEDAGFSAYVVGGSVRDLLLGLAPKDFDVATDARPEQVRQLFRRSRIIGRRFQIVHVLSGRDTIEVTTFRAHHTGSLPPAAGARAAPETSSRSKNGLLLRDNVFGSIEEDAQRRDFTINALYYRLQDNSIHDFAGGFADIQQGVIRIIGDPTLRYREDPVRMLRAARFVAKLGFRLDPASAEPIPHLGHLIRDIPPARLFDETLKLLMTGRGFATFTELRELSLLGPLFPEVDRAIDLSGAGALTFIEHALRNTDERVQSGRRVTPAFLFAALLWPAVCARARHLGEHRPVTALADAANETLSHQLRRIAIPRRFTQPARDIWELQPRLANRSRTNVERLIAHPKFRAAYDFLLLREQAGEDLGGLGHWWTSYQLAAEDGREQLLDDVKEIAAPKPSRRRRSRRPRLASQ